ncbi:MAG: FAD-dependent oxidoreductase [Candidatus Lernaella stagnicola]|nr:FAD-dependent oxidoreductase [Candidatus Lernaella stagnicola]
MSRPKTVLILGGGLAGLTCADELARRGVEVTVLEAGPVVGGLARNVQIHDAGFDLGGHRFFTENPNMMTWLRSLLGDNLLEIGRKSRIRLNGRFFDYPLRPLNALGNFGFKGAAKVLTDYAGAAIRSHLAPTVSDLSLEDWVTRRFGRELYEVYFRPYSEKVWGIPCREISAEWAAERIQLLGLGDAIFRALRPAGKPKTYASRFWYPRGGIGVIANTLAERIRAGGGKVLTGHRVTQIDTADGKVKSVLVGKKRFAADLVVSTMPLTEIGRLTGAPQQALSRLSFRSLRCVFLIIDQPRVTEDTWLYFPESDLSFGRCHEPRNWDPGMAPPGRTSLCLEVFCNEGDEIWRRKADELVAACADDLDAVGLVPRGRVIAGDSIAVANAYPVFRVGFRGPLEEVLASVTALSNLRLTGRTGAYRYENMDVVAERAIALAREVAGE